MATPQLNVPPTIIESADRLKPASKTGLQQVKVDFRSEFLAETAERERAETVEALRRCPSIDLPPGSPVPRTLAELNALEEAHKQGGAGGAPAPAPSGANRPAK